MNWTAIAAIGQIIAAVGVIATLLYLSVQIRQNTEQSRIASSQVIDGSLMSSFDPIYIPENSELWTKGHFSPERLTEHESHMFDMLMARLFQSFNLIAGHHARGLYDEEMFRTIANYFGNLVVTPGGKAWRTKYWSFPTSVARAVLDKEIQRLEAEMQDVA